jgi:hypothetical protein
MDIKEIGCEGVGWIHLAHEWEEWRTVVNMAMNLPVTQTLRHFLTS